MKNSSRAFSGTVLSVVCVLLVAALIVVFNDGITIGYSNHTGMLPVVRRILDPNYLPDNFGISLRFYHHRIFAYIIAGLTRIMGEDNALIALNLAGMTLVSAGLFYLSRRLTLSRVAYLAVGVLLATNGLWTGLGLEINNFVGNPYIMPPTFAHAFILFAIGALMEERYRVVALCAGLAALFHVQIGIIFVLVLLPFYAARAKRIGIRESALLALLLVAPASPSLWHFAQMMGRGLVDPSLSLYYIAFRQPHHFELQSPGPALWVGGHILAQGLIYWWLRRASRIEARKIAVLLQVSLSIAALSLVHYIDYYALKIGVLAKIQFLRLSPAITVFGALALAVLAGAWAERRAGAAQRLSFARFAGAGLLAAAVALGVLQVTLWGKSYYIGVRRYTQRGNQWVDMCRWIERNGPRGIVYLTPPGNDGFAYLANRSNVVEFKINPDGAQYLNEWFERLRDLSGGKLPEERGFNARPALNRNYAAMGEEELLTVGEKYGASCAVLPASSGASFEVLYQNRDYRLVRLPIE